MLQLQLIGHLGQDAVVRIHQNKYAISFSVAHSEKYKNASGTVVERTTWVNCTKWADNDKLAQYLKKGTQVYISGKPGTRAYQNTQNGQWNASLDLNVFELQLLGSKTQSAPTAAHDELNAQFAESAAKDSIEKPDDLPF